MNEQKQLRTQKPGLTIIVIGAITLFIGYLTNLFLQHIINDQLRNWTGGYHPLGAVFSPTIPTEVQLIILLLLGAGMSFVISLSLMRKSSKISLVIGCIPLLISYFTYISLGVFKLHILLFSELSYSYNLWAEKVENTAFSIGNLLLISGCLFLALGLIEGLSRRKRWVHQVD